MTQTCPCGSGHPYPSCCAPLISGARPAPSAEALMRSRYAAHALGEIDYLLESLHPARRAGWDREETARWARGADWLGLEIHEVKEGAEEGTVAFTATYKEAGHLKRHRELSLFRKVGADWRYVEGERLAPPAKVGRNDPCPCGSGKKHKKCCGR